MSVDWCDSEIVRRAQTFSIPSGIHARINWEKATQSNTKATAATTTRRIFKILESLSSTRQGQHIR